MKNLKICNNLQDKYFAFSGLTHFLPLKIHHLHEP